MEYDWDKVDEAVLALLRPEVYDPKPGNHPALAAFMWADAAKPGRKGAEHG